MGLHISRSPEETASLGSALAVTAKPGSVIGLKGDLGAGKTQFVRGFVSGIGSTDRVHSPTFALINEYRGGRLPVYHIDLYRLETAGAILSAGLDEYFRPQEGITLIEWFERLESAGMSELANTVISFEVTSETERRIVY